MAILLKKCVWTLVTLFQAVVFCQEEGRAECHADFRSVKGVRMADAIDRIAGGT